MDGKCQSEVLVVGFAFRARKFAPRHTSRSSFFFIFVSFKLRSMYGTKRYLNFDVCANDAEGTYSCASQSTITSVICHICTNECRPLFINVYDIPFFLRNGTRERLGNTIHPAASLTRSGKECLHIATGGASDPDPDPK